MIITISYDWSREGIIEISMIIPSDSLSSGRRTAESPRVWPFFSCAYDRLRVDDSSVDCHDVQIEQQRQLDDNKHVALVLRLYVRVD